ncbi:TPA: hypothetical protein ACPZAJ_003872 [Yersinia enterocolitica]
MSFDRLLTHFNEQRSETIGSTKYVLATFNADITGKTRAILVNVSHQNRTQANYLSSLNNMMTKWDCRNLVIYLNAATQTLSPSFMAESWCFVDANAEPIVFNGFEVFPLINQDEEAVHYEGLNCFSPRHFGCITESQL